MKIPLPGMMRHWREREFERHLQPATVRSGLRLWAFLAERPALYRLAARLGTRALRLWSGGKPRMAKLPLAGGWTRFRDFPTPEGATFMDQWRDRRSHG